MKRIEFNEIQNSDSGISQLFLDYLNNFEKVQKYFAEDFHKRENWRTLITKVVEKDVDRSTLVRVLTQQNKELHCGIKTLANIDLLGNENTLAIVTGQQVGLLTGPLYTIYKTITTIKLAEELSRDFPAYNFVPIFWAEGEDHDFNEINHVSIFNTKHELARIEYLIGGKPLERNPGPVGNILIDEFIEKFFADLGACIPNTEFKADLLSMMRGYYTVGATLGAAFLGMMNHLFEDSGLVLLNPIHPEFKRLLRPVFQREITAIAKTSTMVVDISAELEERYHAQIKGKPINLFMFHKGGRYLIERRENDFSLKGTRHYFSQEELFAIADQSPDLLSPNVVLRPLCQDTILPTLVYVGGPSEIAYFAQLKPVYEFFGVQMPIVYPRASVTILEERVRTMLEKFQVDILEMFRDIDPLLMRISEQVSEVKVDQVFESLHHRIQESLHEARFGILQIDPTLNGAIESTLAKIEGHLNVLKQKTQRAQQSKQEVSLRQIQKAGMNIFPNTNFQEREFNVGYYMNKYGPDFVKWLSNEIQVDRFSHQVIEI